MRLNNELLIASQEEFRDDFKKRMMPDGDLMLTYRIECNEREDDALKKLALKKPMGSLSEIASDELEDIAAHAFGCAYSLFLQGRAFEDVDEPYRWFLPVMDELFQRSAGPFILHWGAVIQSALVLWYGNAAKYRTAEVPFFQLEMLQNWHHLCDEGLILIAKTNPSLPAAFETLDDGIQCKSLSIKQDLLGQFFQQLVEHCGTLGACNRAFDSTSETEAGIDRVALGLLSFRAGTGVRPSVFSKKVAAILQACGIEPKRRVTMPQDLFELRPLVSTCLTTLKSSVAELADGDFANGLNALTLAYESLKRLRVVERTS
jgi:hypothetical protein